MATKKSSKLEANPSASARPDRDDRVLVAGHFQPDFRRAFRLWALQNDTTMQAVLEEALRDFAAKHKIKL